MGRIIEVEDLQFFTPEEQGPWYTVRERKSGKTYTVRLCIGTNLLEVLDKPPKQRVPSYGRKQVSPLPYDELRDRDW